MKTIKYKLYGITIKKTFIDEGERILSNKRNRRT